jgi:hypothetical protein
MSSRLNESVVEEAALVWLKALGYPPDKQDKATQTVLEQAKLLCGDWAGD